MVTVEQRPLQVGDIEYIFIVNERRNEASAILPPGDFDNQVLRLLRALPKNVIQLNDPFVQYGNLKFVQSESPHRFSLVYRENLELFIRLNPYKDSIKVFFVDPTMSGFDDIVSRLRSHFRLVLFMRIDKPGEVIKGIEDISILSPHDLFKKLEVHASVVNKILEKSFPQHPIKLNVNLPVTEYHKKYDTANSFRASHTNYWTLNQILGIYWGVPTEADNMEEMVIEAAESVKKDRHDTYRLKILLDQVDKIDDLEILVLEDRHAKFPNGKYDWISPIVVVLPFNFPTLGQILDPKQEKKDLKRFIKSLSYEQAINYVSYAQTTETTQEDFMVHAKVTSEKTSYLDGVAYLHASFTESPVVRFPLLGNSIKRELSFFRPDRINWKSFVNSKELINRFGEKLCTTILPDALWKRVFGLPRQIVAITDLPIEWLLHDGLNLSMTHDVTRIPEMPYGGILATFNLHSNLQYKVREDILSRTLVILGASAQAGEDEDFKGYFAQIEEFSKKLNFKTVRCLSKQEVIDNIASFKPDLLIFDCHGGFDESDLSSYLWINGEKITGDDIVQNKLVAPIVFLSACHTNPNYGYVNKIADAFFEAGCLSLTATYFPISIHGGTNLYYRLLSNLNNAAKLGVHKNWLEFVSHIIRTSYCKEVCYHFIDKVALSSIPEKEKKRMTKDLKKLNKDTTLYMLRQDTRADVFKNFEAKLVAIISTSVGSYKDIIPEHCFYTNMGRGDLIKFDSWMRKFYALNGFK